MGKARPILTKVFIANAAKHSNYLFQGYLCTNKELLTFQKKVTLNLRFQVLTLWSAREELFGSDCSKECPSWSSMLLCLCQALLLLKKKKRKRERKKKTTANGSILSINLAITHKYVLDEVFQFDITE